MQLHHLPRFACSLPLSLPGKPPRRIPLRAGFAPRTAPRKDHLQARSQWLAPPRRPPEHPRHPISRPPTALRSSPNRPTSSPLTRYPLTRSTTQRYYSHPPSSSPATSSSTSTLTSALLLPGRSPTTPHHTTPYPSLITPYFPPNNRCASLSSACGFASGLCSRDPPPNCDSAEPLSSHYLRTRPRQDLAFQSLPTFASLRTNHAAGRSRLALPPHTLPNHWLFLVSPAPVAPVI